MASSRYTFPWVYSPAMRLRQAFLRTALLSVLLGALPGCGARQPEPPRQDLPDIRGVVTSLARGGKGGAAATLRIAGSKVPDTRYAKAVVTLTAETRIYQRDPYGRSLVPLESLRLGDKVEVRFAGPVAESYPVQARAAEVLILVHLAAVDPPAVEKDEVGDAWPAQFAGTREPQEKEPPDRLPLTLRAVRAGPQEHFERVVFEFDADTTPGYRIEYIAQPVHCGSGLPAQVAGQSWLQVRFHPAQAHNEQGGSTVGTLQKRTGLKIVQEIQEVCDFEGEVTWIVGLVGRRGYRVLELTNPPRVVVDLTR
jgi:hypothetical protein